MIQLLSLEILSRQRTELFLAEAERDRMVDVARAAAGAGSPQQLKSHIAEVLVALGIRLDPALVAQFVGSRTEPRVHAAGAGTTQC
jgi:hypothetical protein